MDVGTDHSADECGGPTERTKCSVRPMLRISWIVTDMLHTPRDGDDIEHGLTTMGC